MFTDDTCVLCTSVRWFRRILDMCHLWASEGFFQEGGTRGYFQKFSREAKSGEICFLPLKTK